MTRAQEIRKEVLLQLYGARPLARSAASMTREARKGGEDFRETEIVAECAFLEGQGFAEKVRDHASGEIKYTITSKGILEYES